MIRAAIFDYGGVVHSLSKIGSTQRIAEGFNLPVEKIKPFTKKLGIMMGEGKISEEQYWEELSKLVEKPKPQNYQEVWKYKTTEDYVIFPEIIDLVKEIKSQGILVVVLSNTIPPHAEFNREKGGYDYFDKVFLSYEIGVRKPDIRAYKIVLREMNLKANECIYIDDLEENLIPAGELGMQTILAVNTNQVVRAVKKKLSM